MKIKILNLTGIYLAIFFVLCFPAKPMAQNQDRSITVYQYRHVPADKIDEFIKRETTYWSKVAQKAVDNKKMSFWGLLQKVGGYDLPNSSNFLFVNTFPNIDSTGDIWNTAEAVAGVKMSEMETGSMSTITTQAYLHGTGWQEAKDAVAPRDFNYVVMVYHNSNYRDSLVALENKYWAPFIKKAMDNGQTNQKAWGNAVILSPSGDDVKFTTVSYDLFGTLTDALMPYWNSATEFPTEGLGKINDIEIGRRGSVVYRVVKVVSSPD